MSDKKQILVVDDDQFQLKHIANNLSNDFDVLTANGHHQCLEMLNKNSVNAILMDVNMPDVDGFETCRLLKERADSKNTPVIFLSSDGSIDNKITSYGVGGFDYLTKPMSEEVMAKKLSLAIELSEKLQNLEKRSKSAFQTAMTAMRSSSEQGVVIHFLKDSFDSENLSSLGELVLNAVAAYDLNGVLMIKTNFDVEFKRTEGLPTPIEIKLLESVGAVDKIVTIKNRLIINGRYTKLLILNVPEDEELFGRIRDHIAFIVDGCDARCDGLILQNNLTDNRDLLIDIVKNSRQSLTQMVKDQSSHRNILAAALEKFHDKIEKSFSYMGLTEEQEENMLKLLNDLIDKIQTITDAQTVSEVFMTHVISELDSAVEQISVSESEDS